MSLRLQRWIWSAMAVVALGLVAATVFLFALSRQNRGSGPTYRIAYTSVQQGTVEVKSCNPMGQDVRTHNRPDSPGLLPAASPFPPDGQTQSTLAYLAIENPWDHSSPAEDGSIGERGQLVLVRGDGTTQEVGGHLRFWQAIPSWCDGGNHLVFAASGDLNGDGDYTWEELGLYLFDGPNDSIVRVTDAPGIAEITCSPSQLLVIVTEYAEPRPHSRLVDLATGDALMEGAASCACWSPDGTLMAAYVPEDNQIYVMNLDGSDAFQVNGPPGEAVRLMWAPALPTSDQDELGTLVAIAAPLGQIAYQAGPLYSRPARGNGGPWDRLTGSADYVIHAALSPDGRYVAYTVYTGGGGTQVLPDTDLMLLDLDNGQIAQLTSDTGFEGFATWMTTNG